jgi:pyruvate/oxaloacetate carboxyltransferase
MTKLATMTAVIALLAGAAFAQTSTTSPSTGSTQMSEAQIKQKLQQEGYSNVKLQRESQPEYTGTATKNGKTVHIEVEANGQVHERQQ